MHSYIQKSRHILKLGCPTGPTNTNNVVATELEPLHLEWPLSLLCYKLSSCLGLVFPLHLVAVLGSFFLSRGFVHAYYLLDAWFKSLIEQLPSKRACII